MTPRVIDTFELRSNPALISELREHPGEFVERRFAPLTTLETRASDTDNGWQATGLAAVFDDLSENLGGFRERIKRGAFRKVLRNDPDVRFLFNHDPNLPLARTHAGSLQLRETSGGLEYTADVAPTSFANDLRVLMDSGIVNQSSFAFRVEPGGDDWFEDEETGGLIREIREFSSLYDVSAVVYPAYPTATSGVKRSANLLRDIAESLDRSVEEQHQDVTPSVSEQAPEAVAEERGEQADTNDKRAHVDDPDTQVRCLSAAEAAGRLRRAEQQLKRVA